MRLFSILLLLALYSTSQAASDDFIGNWRKVSGDGEIQRISIYKRRGYFNVVAHIGRRALAYTRSHVFKNSKKDDWDLIIARKDDIPKFEGLLRDERLYEAGTYNFLILERLGDGRLSAHCCKRTPGKGFHFKAIYEKGKTVKRRKVKPKSSRKVRTGR